MLRLLSLGYMADAKLTEEKVIFCPGLSEQLEAAFLKDFTLSLNFLIIIRWMCEYLSLKNNLFHIHFCQKQNYFASCYLELHWAVSLGSELRY